MSRYCFLPFSLIVALLSTFDAAIAADCGCAAQCAYGASMCLDSCRSSCNNAAKIREGAKEMSDGIKQDREARKNIRESNWYGAIAFGPDGSPYGAYIGATREEAKKVALENCAKSTHSTACRITHEFKDRCASVSAGAAGAGMVFIGEPGMSIEQTRTRALQLCNQKTQGCHDQLTFCSTADEKLASYEKIQADKLALAASVMDELFDKWTGKSQSNQTHTDVTNSSPLLEQRIWEAKAVGPGTRGFPQDGPSLQPGGPNLAKIIATEMTGQQFLICDYQPLVKGARSTSTFYFWYKSAPGNIDDLMTIDVLNSFGLMGNKGYAACPSTHGEAKAAADEALAYSNTPRFLAVREKYQANKAAQLARDQKIRERVRSGCAAESQKILSTQNGPAFSNRDSKSEAYYFAMACEQTMDNYADLTTPLKADRAVQCTRMEEGIRIEQRQKIFTAARMEKFIYSYQVLCRN